MLGAVSSTDGALDGIESAEGWYEGDGGLCVSYNGKPSSRSFDALEGENRDASRSLTDFFFGEADTSERGLSAARASLKKSTMAASAACCSPSWGACRLSPSVAVVLSATDRRDVVSE
jgi:hypothetical protein